MLTIRRNGRRAVAIVLTSPQAGNVIGIVECQEIGCGWRALLTCDHPNANEACSREHAVEINAFVDDHPCGTRPAKAMA